MTTFTKAHRDLAHANFRQEHSRPNSHRNVSDAMKRREWFTFNRNENQLWQWSPHWSSANWRDHARSHVSVCGETAQ